MTDWDVAVVGAGPAGSAAALDLSLEGASVLLVDRAPFPRWKVCGACLSPGALRLLAGLGLDGLVERLGAVPLSRLVLSARAGSARVPLPGSASISRAALDAALVGAAERAGATFWPEAQAALGGLDGNARRLRIAKAGAAVEVSARVVIDASGLAGGLGRGLGRGLGGGGRAPSEAPPPGRIGIGAEIDDPAYPVELGELRMVVGRAGYVGLVRVEDGSLNVAAAVDSAALRAVSPGETADAILSLARLPPLASPRHGWRGTPALMRAPRDVGAERLFRLGDAAGYAEPFTGEGICWALGDGRSAAALARRALDHWHEGLLGDWRRYRRERRRRSERLCRALARALRRPWLVDAAVASLRVAPALATPFVRRAGRAAEPLAAIPA